METIIPSDKASACSTVFTRDHRYVGQIIIGGRRLADVLSDPNLDVIEMHDALVQSTGARPAEVSCDRLLVLKRDILMVVPQGDHEAPVRRHNNYQPKRTQSVTIVLPGYVLAATAHMPDRPHSRMLVDEIGGLPAFYGLTEVTVQGASDTGAAPRYDTVIVNRRQIEAAELSRRPSPPTEESAATALLGT